MNARLRCLVFALLVAVASLLSAPQRAAAQQPSPPPSKGAADAATEAARKDQGRKHFEQGLKLSEENAWDAALAEFLHSTELYPTRGAAKNAAICLRKLRRYDEALDTLERTLTQFSQIPADEKTAIEREIAELSNLVGTLDIKSEPGARVFVDSRERGTLPLDKPIRVAVGTRAVRLVKEGFSPAETKVEVGAQQKRTVEVVMPPLSQAGSLSVTETTGKAVDVLVDGAVLGKTPWTGRVSPGDHTIALRGTEHLGTQPVGVTVRAFQTTRLSLAIEQLDATLSVRANPVGATLLLDDVRLGSGSWNGAVRAGRHTVEASSAGYFGASRTLEVAAGTTGQVELLLERDPEAPLWAGARRAKFFGDLALAFALTPSLGGGAYDCVESSGPSCSAGIAFGGSVIVHAGYELASGLGFGLSAGYARVQQGVSDRQATLEEWPDAARRRPVTIKDDLALGGLLLGGAISLHRGERLRWLARVDAGVFIGTIADEREAGASDGSYRTASLREAPGFVALQLSPEAGLGYRMSDRWELTVSLRALILAPASKPTWTDKSDVVTPDIGLARYGEASLLSPVLVMPALGIGARVEL